MHFNFFIAVMFSHFFSVLVLCIALGLMLIRHIFFLINKNFLILPILLQKKKKKSEYSIDMIIHKLFDIYL